jgi:DNA-binding GntR family transcriptional regulator
MNNPQVNYETAAEYVYRAIKKDIFTKKLKAGQRLPEAAIAKELQVSRTPVREALRKLANEGLVIITPNAGARLVSPSLQEINDAFELRNYLEQLAIAKAIHKITPLQICRLEEAIEEEERIFERKDLEDYLRINIQFHHIIAEAAGNSLLVEYVDNVLSRIYVFMVFYESFFDFDTNPSLDEHRELVKAFKLRDKKLAQKLMEHHILHSAEALKVE